MCLAVQSLGFYQDLRLIPPAWWIVFKLLENAIEGGEFGLHQCPFASEGVPASVVWPSAHRVVEFVVNGSPKSVGILIVPFNLIL